MRKNNINENTIQPLIDRKLPERSFLKFYFPITEKRSSNRYYVVSMPFYENISIKESKKARYQKHSLVSRSSNLYTYMGADSRVLSLDFNITLPHIMDLHPDARQNLGFPGSLSQDLSNKTNEKKRFKTPTKISKGIGSNSISHKLGTYYTKKEASETLKMLFKSNWYRNINLVDKQLLISRYKDENAVQDRITLKGIDLFDLDFTNPNDIEKLRVASSSGDIATLAFRHELEKADKTIDEATLLKNKMVDLIIYWVNIIRCSVTNNSQNPMYGPPLLRLRHGIMYQNVPCICTDYSIEANESAGYDLDTLLPRQLKVSLKLEELRTGSFGTFDPESTSIVERDNLAGWEAVVLGLTNSMDPGFPFGTD